MEAQERYYKGPKLHIWFAASCILLVTSLVWAFASDYSREWKNIQKSFRQLQIEKTRAAIAEETSMLEEDDEYQSILEELAQANAALKKNESMLETAGKKIRGLKAQSYKDDQAYLFVKADYDTAKYVYENALGHGRKNVESAKSRLDELAKEMLRLRRIAETTETELKEQEGLISQFKLEVKKITGEKYRFSRKKDTLGKNLVQLDPERMTLSNRLADQIRDLPVIDFLSPYYKIRQTVIKDVMDDVVFARVPRVDRCTTCHLGMVDSEFENEAQPFKNHPRLDLFLSSQSPHPAEKFGCTSCHQGRGRGTSFYSAAHEPSSAGQKEDWERKYGWQRQQHWEKPMYPLKYVEAGCLQCHIKETFIQGADKLNLGLNLIERSGCFGCHLIEKYKDKRRIGPDLNRIASKVSREWVERWIKNTTAFRPNTWMPKFFRQFNTSDEASIKRTDQEIHAIVDYLFKKSGEFELFEIPVAGDAGKGEKHIASYGCFGCHRIEAEKIAQDTTLQTLRRDQGPNLIGLGSKTSEKWVYNWVKNPARYFPRTKMPNLRLSDQEAADIAAYLIQKRQDRFMQSPIPAQDDKELNKIVMGFLMKMTSESDAKAQLSNMVPDKKLIYAGEKLIRLYGCFSCHNVPGFEKEKPIGTELTNEGSKPVEKLDFGFIDIERTNHAWFTKKLKNPRIFDKDRVRPHDEKLRMPNFEYTDKEVEAIVTALLGFVKKDVLTSKEKSRNPRNIFVEQGQWIVREYNCQGCHIIEKEGGAIRPMIHSWLMNIQNKSLRDADDLMVTFSPPVLQGEGQKVQTEWLFDFIHGPVIIRPWLTVRMPTFALDETQVNTLIRYFSYLDNQNFPFTEKVVPKLAKEEHAAAGLLFSKKFFDCGSCHIRGKEFPEGSPVNWAPNFALAKDRLKPLWMIEWIKDPQALLPGTKMPSFYDPDPEYFHESGPEKILDGDEEKQIRVLRDYILTTY